MTYVGDAINIPEGDMGTIYVLPEEYRPLFAVTVLAAPHAKIQVRVTPSGAVSCYNYSDAVNGQIAARFTLTYVSGK